MALLRPAATPLRGLELMVPAHATSVLALMADDRDTGAPAILAHADDGALVGAAARLIPAALEPRPGSGAALVPHRERLIVARDALLLVARLSHADVAFASAAARSGGLMAAAALALCAAGGGGVVHVALVLLDQLARAAESDAGVAAALAAPEHGILPALAYAMATCEGEATDALFLLGNMSNLPGPVYEGPAGDAWHRAIFAAVLAQEGTVARLLQIIRRGGDTARNTVVCVESCLAYCLLWSLHWALCCGQPRAAAAAVAALDSVTQRGRAEAWDALLRDSPAPLVADVVERLGAAAASEAAAHFSSALGRELAAWQEEQESAAAAGAATEEQAAEAVAAAAAALPEQDEAAVALEGAGLPPRACAACGRQAIPGVRLKLCRGCRSDRYCSDACAKAAWRAGHRDECRELQAQRAAAAQPAAGAAAAGM
ncbi:MAG: hypothetical protein J3K34DRAFT_497386 [Monoraphidium minutum]|nr:MAG: hypothetical protein J3K34DRAFT_497386 [Monoraphidium minutum]